MDVRTIDTNDFVTVHTPHTSVGTDLTDEEVLQQQQQQQDTAQLEPVLEYSTFTTALPEHTKMTAIRVCDRFVVVGTATGQVSILDFNGNQIRLFQSHISAVSDVAFDAAQECVVSCGFDGTVAVECLFSEEEGAHLDPIAIRGINFVKSNFSGPKTVNVRYPKPVRAVALGSQTASNTTASSGSSQILCGREDGVVCVNTQNWLRGRRDVMLSKEDSSVVCVGWKDSLVAWATQKGVKIYNYRTSTRVGFIRFISSTTENNNNHNNNNISSNNNYPVFLCWDSQTSTEKNQILISAREDKIKIVAVQVGEDGLEKLVLLHSFTTDFLIYGLSIVGPFLAVLANVREDDFSLHIADERDHPAVPELRILSRDNAEYACDAVHIPSSLLPLPPNAYRLHDVVDGIGYIWCEDHIITVDLKNWLAWASDRIRASVAATTPPSLWERIGGDNGSMFLVQSITIRVLQDPLVGTVLKARGQDGHKIVQDEEQLQNIIKTVCAHLAIWAGGGKSESSSQLPRIPLQALSFLDNESVFVAIQYHTLCVLQIAGVSPKDQKEALHVLSHVRALLAV